MKTTKLKIKNVLGIKQLELDGKSIELSGTNGVGKSSVLDAIRKILTNNFPREVLITKGETESEIYLETDTGLSIDRKIRKEKNDFIKVSSNGTTVSSPQSFLNGLFTPLQLDPIGFTQMTRQEKNRILLDLVEFSWDLDWIQEQFGEIPQGVNYQQNILQVLYEIQSKNGRYYLERQEINSSELHKRKNIQELEKEIPADFDVEKWEAYSVSQKSAELTKIQQQNGQIERAKLYMESYDNKIRGFEADKRIAIANEEKLISSEREQAEKNIERLQTEIKAEQDKLQMLRSKLADRIAVVEGNYKEQVAKLDGDIRIANEYANKEIADISKLQTEIAEAERMKAFVNEYKRMLSEKEKQKHLAAQSEELTRKIELARELPSKILKAARMPIDNLTVVDGVPLINGLPIDNLSDGEQLQLCVDISVSKTGNLQIILIDGAERLSTENRNALYEKCKEKGVQIIATRTTDDEFIQVTEL